MKKNIFKYISVFLLFFLTFNICVQEKQKVNARSEVVTLTVGATYTVLQILSAVGFSVEGGIFATTIAQAFMTSPYVSSEQEMRLRAQTPTSLDTPGCVEEEDLKSAYKFKEAVKNGEIVLPKIPTIQTFNALGDFTITNFTDNISHFYDYSEEERVKISSIIHLRESGVYKLTANLKNGQNFGNSGFSQYCYFECLDSNSSILLMSVLAYNSYDLRINYLDKNNTPVDFRYSDLYHNYEDSEVYKTTGSVKLESDSLYYANSFTQNDTYTFHLEKISDGLGIATGEVTNNVDFDMSKISTSDVSIPISEADSICVNVPSSIVNSWDSLASADVIGSNTSALENTNGDKWDSEFGWQSSFDVISGMLGDILGAIKGVGKDVFDNFENTLDSISQGIQDVISSVNDVAKNVCDSLGLTVLFDSIIDAINSITFDDIINSIKSLTWTDVVNAILSLPALIGDIFSAILNDILQAIKDLIGLLKKLLIELFVPSNTFFQDNFNNLRDKLVPFMNIDDFNNIFNRDYTSGDVEDYYFNFMGNQHCIPLSIYNSIKADILSWIRGIMYFLLVLFNLKNIYRLIRGGSLIKDINTLDNAANGRVGGAD